MRLQTIIIFLLLRGALFSQTADTLRLNLKEVDQRFLDKNLVLLVNHANVDVAKALTEQARLWDNPVASTSNGLFNTSTTHFNPQQTYIQVGQLFRLGQKRQKLVDFQQENERLSEAQFTDLLRNLRYTLHTRFYQLASGYKKLHLIENERGAIQNLLARMTPLVQSGNATQKDLVRFQTIAYGLEQDALSVRQDNISAQSDLRTLLQITSADTTIVPVLVQNTEGGITPSAAALLAEAQNNRADVQIAMSQSQLAQKNWTYQKAMAVPDLEVSLGFDPAGSFASNGLSLGLSMPLPILNKNQGNIKAAQIGINQAKQTYEATTTQIQNQILAAYAHVKMLDDALSTDRNDYFQNFDGLMKNVTTLYQSKQVSLLDFVDMFESYKDTQLRRLQTETDRNLAREELNFQVGRQIF